MRVYNLKMLLTGDNLTVEKEKRTQYGTRETKYLSQAGDDGGD